MAGKNIKGLTVEIGGDTTKLGKALEDVNKKSSSLSGELRDINRLLKLDPTNTELLAQKQKVLSDAVSNTEDKLDKLKEAERQVQEQFERGEVSEEQVRELQREIIDTTKRLENYEKAAKETADEIDRLGRESDDAADEIDTLGREASEAEQEADDLGDTLSDGTSAGLTAVVGLATAAAAAVVGAAEASRDYRREMGKLDTAFESVGFSQEAATTTYKELQGVLGETEQAVEASNLLAKLATSEEDLSQWTDILTGVYGEFGASIPVEGLAEAANETKRVGQVTGPLADALNWAAQEGETFGVTLKKNIKFTELSSKELEGLTDKQKAEYEARKEQYDAIEDYNKRVEEAASAEDMFNLALENCTNEQERQQLITKTLTKLYGKSAEQYKKTNKQIIESNKANEEWNETMAEVGESVEPVITDIKKFGTGLLKNAKEPVKDIAGFISNTFLPALTKISTWVLNNIPTIKAGVAGVTAAFVAYKVATIAAEVAQVGLKGAIMATTVAQKALALAQAATPWGLVATAVSAVVVGLVALSSTTKEAAKEANFLTEEEKALQKQVQETAAQLRDQRAAADEASSGIASQMGHISSMATELQTLADASGKVKAEDEARVKFILNELNEALGTEYQMTDGIIQKYGELKKNIDAVIQSKTVNSLLEANNESYVTALNSENDMLKNVQLAEKEYLSQKESGEQKIKGYNERIAEYQEKLATATETTDQRKKDLWESSLTAYKGLVERENQLTEEKRLKYEEAAVAYGENAYEIMNYEEAQTASLEGNYERAKQLLVNKSDSFHEYSDEVDDATVEVLDSLYKEAINAGIEADRTKKNFEAGVKGYTKKMVEESEKGYKEALEAYGNAYVDAYGVGEDMGSGLSEGMENKRQTVLGKIKSIVSAAITAAREAADSNSPSKKTISLGEDMGEGTEIGLDNKKKAVQKAAQRQVDSVLDVYEKGFDPAGQATANALQAQSTRRQVQSITAINDNTASKLDKILTAIEKGQILTINGDKFVGGTADKYDDTLGIKRILIERGAMA